MQGLAQTLTPDRATMTEVRSQRHRAESPHDHPGLRTMLVLKAQDLCAGWLELVCVSVLLTQGG